MRKIWSACCRSSVIDTRCVEAHLQTMCVGACNSYMHAAIFLLHVAVWCGGRRQLMVCVGWAGTCTSHGTCTKPEEYSMGSYKEPSSIGQKGANIVGGGQPYLDNPGPGPVLMSADSLTGDSVVSATGEDLGEIEAIMLDVARECFILDVEKDRLKNAPGFDKDHWPAMADMQWASDIHSYYGSRHYWEQDRI